MVATLTSRIFPSWARSRPCRPCPRPGPQVHLGCTGCWWRMLGPHPIGLRTAGCLWLTLHTPGGPYPQGPAAPGRVGQGWVARWLWAGPRTAPGGGVLWGEGPPTRYPGVVYFVAVTFSQPGNSREVAHNRGWGSRPVGPCFIWFLGGSGGRQLKWSLLLLSLSSGPLPVCLFFPDFC